MIAARPLVHAWRGRTLAPLLTAAFGACAALTAWLAIGRSSSAAFAMPGIAALLYIARNWRIGVGVLFVLASTDGFIKHLHPSFATYALKDGVTLAIYAGAFIPLLAHKSVSPLRRTAIVTIWLVFVAYFAANGLREGTGALEGVAGFRQHIFFSGLMFVGAVAFAFGTKFSRYVDIAIGCIAFAAVAGIVQYEMGDAWLMLSPTFAKLELHYRTADIGSSGIATHFYRAFGTLVDPAAMGDAAAYGCALTLASFARWNRRARLFGAAAMIAMIFVLVLSAARTSMLGLAVGACVVLLFSVRPENRKRVATTVGAILLVCIVIAVSAGKTLSVRFQGSSEQSAFSSRLAAAEQLAWRMRDQPLGLGLGSSGAGGNLSAAIAQKPKDTLLLDNLYLSYLYEGGPAGLLLFLMVQGALLVVTVRRIRSAKSVDGRSLFVAMAGGQVVLLASGLTNQGVIDYAPVCQMFWFFCGGLLVDERFREARA